MPDEPAVSTARRRYLRALGPGVITGAADDDPAGITTYSVAGAQFGLGLLWLAPLTWPLMAAVQSTCGRVGMVTGGGLMDALRRKFSRPVLLVAAIALFAANTFNVGADLSGMADAAEQLTGVTSRVWVLVFGISIGWATVQLHYSTIAKVMRWLVLVLFAYVIAAFSIGPDWHEVARATLLPTMPHGAEWPMVVAILGTTISPYLFFWQASAEVEEEIAAGRTQRAQRVGATQDEIVMGRVDIGVGTFFGNLTFFFITLTTALTLHRHGITHPGTTNEVASALRPIAGPFATQLYTIGILGTGVLAIPTLAGSAAYALCELFDWPEGMDERPLAAPRFYGVFSLSIALSIGAEFANFSPVRALYLSAIINGVLAPFLLAGILAVASDARVMEGQPSPLVSRIGVAVTTVAMFVAALAMAM